jgi:hypothetical protein
MCRLGGMVSRPTGNGDGSTAIMDPWEDDEGVVVECHGNLEGKREAWSVERE